MIAGLRHDRARFRRVDSDLDANSGSRERQHHEPQTIAGVRPWADTEFFVNAGPRLPRKRCARHDHHASIRPTASPPPTACARWCARAARRSACAPRLLPYTQLALTAWTLDLDSELLYVGDAGATEANRASERHGVELGVYVTPREWLTLDADLAWSRGRFSEFGCGRAIAFRAPSSAWPRWASPLQHPSGWFGGARFRHFGKAPLIEDDSVRSDPTTLVNLEIGRRIGRRFSISLAAYNLFDSDDNDITYFYESQLPGEGAPVEDRHFHPVEPRTLRLTVETRW